jgi:hypothetical protein
MAEILECGHAPSPHGEHTTGYGVDIHGARFCYECAAKRDRADMLATGRATLYLTDKGLTNWPGSLFIIVSERKTGRHNMARVRYDVWFTFGGAEWHGVQYGDNTQICHCRRIKS